MNDDYLITRPKAHVHLVACVESWEVTNYVSKSFCFCLFFFDEFFLTFVVEGNKLRDQPLTSPNNSKEKNPRLEKIKALVTPEEGVLVLFLMITWEFTKPELVKSIWKYGKCLLISLICYNWLSLTHFHLTKILPGRICSTTSLALSIPKSRCNKKKSHIFWFCDFGAKHRINC